MLCGCVQPTSSTGFNPAGHPRKTLPDGVPHRVAVIVTGNPAICGQAEKLFSTGLLGMGFDVVERNKLSAVTGEIDLSRSGYVSPETAIKYGHLAGADGIFIGNATGERSATWTDTHLSLRLVETTTGKTIWSVNANDPRLMAVSMAIETSIIYTTKAALRSLQTDISKIKPISQ